jgi:hypothetical protein
MQSMKPFIFFLFILLLIIYLYFNIQYIEMFHKYFSFILLICGIIGIFLYPIANKIHDQESFESIKSLVIERFRKK